MRPYRDMGVLHACLCVCNWWYGWVRGGGAVKFSCVHFWYQTLQKHTGFRLQPTLKRD